MTIKDRKVLGIIPARGGSKGVLRKNIRDLAGKPLIGYSIESAKCSQYLTDFVVSTDDQEIAEVAHSFEADVLIRPANLAEDKTPMLPVLQYTLEQMEQKNGVQYDFIVILQPTAPMREAQDIDDAIVKITESGDDSLVSLYKVEDCHPSRMYTLEEDKMRKVMPEPEGALRQALPDVFHRNGCVYISSRDLIVNQGTIISDSCYPYIMSAERSVNIDTELDLAFAEFIFQRKKA